MQSLRDNKPFELRLAETIAWCVPRVDGDDPATSLRSEQLRPRVLESDRAWTVQGVLSSRASVDPGVRAAVAAQSVHDLLGGRLLLFYPDLTLADGAAEGESGGFFDLDNTPPWDTWVGLFRHEDAEISERDYLVSWVPPEFIRAVERGIFVNPEECILWLADSQVPLVAELRAAGLLPDGDGRSADSTK
jgi:hypothetical protein